VTVSARLREQWHEELALVVVWLPNATPAPELADQHALKLLRLQGKRLGILKAEEVRHLLNKPDVLPETLVSAGILYDTVEMLLSSSGTLSASLDVLSLRDLLVTPEPELSFLAAPLIPQGVTLLVGYSGTFKTWAACVLALDLAHGRHFLGHFGVMRPYSVLFCENEMSRVQLARRFRLLGADPTCDRLRFIIGPLDLFDRAQRDYLLRREEDVFIFDPLVGLFRGDENSAGDVRRFFEETIFPLKRAGKSVILLHHVRKPIPGQPPSDLDALIRGSGDWKAACDSALVLVRQDEQRALVHHVKARDTREAPSFVLRLDADDARAGLVYDGEAEHTLPGLRPVREAVLEALGEEVQGPNDVLSCLRGRYTERVIRETLSVLVAEGIVERIHMGRRVIYSRNGQRSQVPLDDPIGEEPAGG
jgi:DNA-binding transcriptional ArsR family regulator